MPGRSQPQGAIVKKPLLLKPLEASAQKLPRHKFCQSLAGVCRHGTFDEKTALTFEKRQCKHVDRESQTASLSKVWMASSRRGGTSTLQTQGRGTALLGAGRAACRAQKSLHGLSPRHRQRFPKPRRWPCFRLCISRSSLCLSSAQKHLCHSTCSEVLERPRRKDRSANLGSARLALWG